MAEAAQMRCLLLASMFAIDRTLHRDLRIARPVRIGIGADVADDAQRKLPAVPTGDHEADRITLPDAPAIGVAGQRMHRVRPWSRHRTARSSWRERSGSPSCRNDARSSPPAYAQETIARGPK